MTNTSQATRDAGQVDAGVGEHQPMRWDTSHAGKTASGPAAVLGLFLILAVCVVIVFTLFGAMVRPEDRGWVPRLTFRYLYMPVVATSLLVAIDAYRAEWKDGKGWWLFLVTAPVPVINIMLSAMWLLKWRPSNE